MTTGVLFATASALLFAILDVQRKLLGEKHGPVVVLIGLSAGAIPLAALGTALDGWPSLSTPFWGWVVLAATFHLVANLLFLRALQISPLSLTIPYLGFTPVFSGLCGMLFLGEAPTLTGVIGIGVVTLGAIWINPAPPGGKRVDIFRALLHERGSLMTLGVAFLWGTSTLLDKKAINAGSEMMYLLAVNAIVFLALLIFVWKSRRAELIRLFSSPGLLLLAALVLAGAMLTQFFAYRTLFVGYTEAIKRGGILISVLFGILFFGEKNATQRLTGSALIVAGVALVILG